MWSPVHSMCRSYFIKDMGRCFYLVTWWFLWRKCSFLQQLYCFSATIRQTLKSLYTQQTLTQIHKMINVFITVISSAPVLSLLKMWRRRWQTCCPALAWPPPHASCHKPVDPNLWWLAAQARIYRYVSPWPALHVTWEKIKLAWFNFIRVGFDSIIQKDEIVRLDYGMNTLSPPAQPTCSLHTGWPHPKEVAQTVWPCYSMSEIGQWISAARTAV